MSLCRHLFLSNFYKIFLIKILHCGKILIHRNKKGGVKMTNEQFNIIVGELQKINTRLDNLEKRLGNVDARLESVETRLDNLETRVANLEEDVKMLRESLYKHEREQIIWQQKIEKELRHRNRILIRYEATLNSRFEEQDDMIEEIATGLKAAIDLATKNQKNIIKLQNLNA